MQTVQDQIAVTGKEGGVESETKDLVFYETTLTPSLIL